MSPPRDLRGVTSVVVNWQTADLTLRSVRALVADGVPADGVVVVDNGSGDEEVERLRRELPGVEVLALGVNTGFARANNVGARARPGAAAYLFVNSDAFVRRPGSIARLLAALERPRVGIVVPRLLNSDGTLQRSVTPRSRPLPELVRALGLSRLVPDRLQPRLGAHWSHGESREIEAAIGAVLLVRGRLWEELRGFDESRFMYAEDLDLFWRAGALGWQAWFEAGAEFIHVGGGSTTSGWRGRERAQAVATAEAAMLRRHLPAPTARMTLGVIAAGVAARALVRAVFGRRSEAATLAAAARSYAAGALGRRSRPRAR